MSAINSGMKNDHAISAHRIEVKLREQTQLFNSMDPAPFHEKDLDPDAEEFIESWAREYPRTDPVQLIVHLEVCPDGAGGEIEHGVHHHFAIKEKLAWLELRQLLRRGRASLLIGASCLAMCLLTGQYLLTQAGPGQSVLRESLTIAGWVAMWHPMEIFLYEWWPLRHRAQLYRKLSRMPVTVKCRE